MKNNIPLFPLVSVVIPALNEESNIGRVVRSIFSQCPYGTELEVIVVDDGSGE
jgi:glycosyltransferase involved in cell wall biosynthesis